MTENNKNKQKDWCKCLGLPKDVNFWYQITSRLFFFFNHIVEFRCTHLDIAKGSERVNVILGLNRLAFMRLNGEKTMFSGSFHSFRIVKLPSACWKSHHGKFLYPEGNKQNLGNLCEHSNRKQSLFKCNTWNSALFTHH